MIKKRAGHMAPLDIKYIQKQTKPACDKWGLSQSELELDSQFQFYNGMSSKNIQTTLIKTAVSKIDIDVQNWSFVAAELFLNDLYHEVGHLLNGEKGRSYPKFITYINKGMKENILSSMFSIYTEEEFNYMDEIIKPERDELFNYLGILTTYDRYLLRDINGDVFELPQHMFMAIGMFLSQNESDDLIEYNGKMIREKIYWSIRFYDMLSNLYILNGTPTLANARKRFSQLNSCYIGASPDNIEGIFNSYKDMAILSKFGGGIGWDWTLVRSMKSKIQEHKGVAGGVVPWLKINNDVAIAVDQLGTRKGAIAIYLEPWHLDIHDFLDLKKNSGEERRRAHDVFPSLWISDCFMKRVTKDDKWTLFDPYETPQLKTLFGEEFEKEYERLENDETITKETIKAKDLWKKILTSYFESGSPFLTFKDNANKRHMLNHDGIIRSSNLCTEIFGISEPDKYGMKIVTEKNEYIFEESKELEHFNGMKLKAKEVLNGYKLKLNDGIETVVFAEKTIIQKGKYTVCNLASVNLGRLNTPELQDEWIPVAIRCLDNVIDINYYPVEQTLNFQKDYRGTGLGLMGEAEYLAVNQIMFGSEEHFNTINKIMERISFNAVKSSINLAKIRGKFAKFEGSKWSKGLFHWENFNEVLKEGVEEIAPEIMTILNRNPEMPWEELRPDLIEFGIRNGYLMAIAPTGTISILAGTTQTIEPIYKTKYLEDNLSGLIPVVAPKLSPDTWNFYPNAYEIEQFDIIKAAVIRQKWIDQGQSLNIFITLEKASGKYLNDLYVLAWKLGLKSTYYLRSKSPEQKHTKENDVMDRKQECVGCQ
jgi:ribonucleoside-diphosphate reductase alpha chain